MKPAQFSIHRWSAWAPGLEEPAAWVSWAKQPWAPVGQEAPALCQVNPALRRRIDRLGRMAFHAVAECQREGPRGPFVFASRHGDSHRSVQLLRDLAQNLALSPASFALSVHNGVGSQYSLAKGDTSNLLAISAGRFTTETALIEACALLRDGNEVVYVIVYDSSPAAFYAPYFDEPAADFAFCLEVRAGADFSLSLESAVAPSKVQVVPHALECLEFLLGSSSQLRTSHLGSTWGWSRHANST
jgi:hypothetical protein